MPASTRDLGIELNAPDSVEVVGDAWQAAGATGLCLLRNGHRLWSRGSIGEAPVWSASAVDRAGNAFTLEVSGIAESGERRARLRSDVTLIASLSLLDDEISKLTDRLIEQQDQLVAVSELATAVRARSDAREVLETLVELAAALTGAEYAAAMVVSDSERIAVAVPDRVDAPLDLDSVFEYARQIDRSILLSDTDHDSWPPPFLLTPECRRLVISPIRLSGAIAGVISVVDRRPEGLTIASRHLLETVAAQAEAIIELILAADERRERDRLERETELASVVQRSLIPTSIPVVPGLDLATYYRPASQLGGDLFDCVLRPDGRLAIAVADVSGKGTAAAMVMAAARMSVRGAAFRGMASDAASMMRRVVEDLDDELGNMGRFMTLFLGVIDPEEGQIVIANAGHSPVILVRDGEEAALVEAEVPPIGVMMGISMKNQIIPFEPGSALIIATDGFPEASSPDGELFGYGRMLDLVSRMSHERAERIADELVAAVDAFAGDTEQSDDQALVIVKRQVA